jgi:D-amino-acid dehydrogenase
LERGPDLASGSSFGTAGIVGASHVLPLSNRQALLDGIRWLPRADSPFAMKPRPELLPWLARFTAAANPRHVRRAGRVLRKLSLDSARMHAELADAGLDTSYRQRGLLNVYGTRRAFAEAREAAAADAEDGLKPEIVDPDALDTRFPLLAPGPVGGVFYADEAHCDSARFVHAVGEQAVEAGCTIRTGVEVLELRTQGTQVQSLWTTAGEIRAGQVVLAAGVWSPQLVAGLPFHVPVQAGKGYHVEVQGYEGLEHPVWFQEARILATPLDGRVRLAGTLELSGIDHRVDPVRIASIIRAARTGLRGFDSPPIRHVWRGMRPCTPDGLPIVGYAPGVDNLVLATGHGMWGLQLGPVTGRLVGELMTGAPPSGDLHPLRPERFRRRDERIARSVDGMRDTALVGRSG